MTKIIITSILIQATPAEVWKTLTSFTEYQIWNSFILNIEGTMKVQEQLSVTMQLSNKKPMTFKPLVIEVLENERFSWKGKLLIKGVFDGFHQFELIDNGDGTTTFVQKEEFKGILIPFLKKMIEVDTKSAFEKMNQELKERIEK